MLLSCRYDSDEYTDIHDVEEDIDELPDLDVFEGSFDHRSMEADGGKRLKIFQTRRSKGGAETIDILGGGTIPLD
jgi:hypothetical protein